MADLTEYDLIVIGAGSGLNISSLAAGQYGWKVALVEKGPLGGTCLNRGCIPSKMLIHVADLAEEIRGAKKLGLTAEITKIDFAGIVERVSKTVDGDAESILAANKSIENIQVYQAEGFFVEPKILDVGGKKITADKIVIAAGGRPFVPPIPGLEEVEHMTSLEALRLTEQPESMIVIGGGYIATELGHFYGALGTKMTFVEMGQRLVFREDDDISEAFTKSFSEKYEVLLEHKAVQVAEKDGEKVVTVEDKSGQQRELRAESLLLAVGRRSNSDLLKVADVGIEVDQRGFIQVDEHFQTAVEGVWAFGDIIGKAPFKHISNAESRVVAHNIKESEQQTMDYSIVPHAIFSSPQVAGVGVTEQEAKEQGLSYKTSTHEYKKTGMGLAMGEELGFVKFITDPKSKKILGCHIIGPQASTLIHEVIVAMTAASAEIDAIRSSIHIHPALSEVVQRALR